MAGATRATALLRAADVEHRVHRYPHDPRAEGFGAAAVAALSAQLDVVAERILKTLIITVDGAPATAVLPVPHQLDLKAAAAALGGRRAQLTEAGTARRVTGYVLGGVCPLAQRTNLPTVVHDAVMSFPTVLCSGGARGVEIELDPAELVRLSAAVLAPITRR